MLDTRPLLENTDFPILKRDQLQTLQANLGYLCNLSCTHCHVNAGPRRTELMDRETVDTLLAFLDRHRLSCLDVTGGAPEMNPHFCDLVAAARQMGVTVIDRCNLTVLLEPGFEHIPGFLAEQQVCITASLPCYAADNVAEQRGKGVYEKSVQVLKQLNDLGYGRDPALPLNLVYNPNGSFLPPPQQQLQADYKRELMERHGLVFNELLTITNMPISRFGSVLLSKGQYESYMQLLKDNYDAANLSSVMCRSLISVDWRGYVYDCDFNQMLDWPLRFSGQTIASDRPRVHLSQLLEEDLTRREILVGDHCYGCTAGQGSSCSGALA